MTHNYLLEIGCEEIPARFMRALLEELQEKTQDILQKNQIGYQNIKTLGTYRRLAIVITGLDKIQPKRTQLIQGPPSRIAVGPNNEWLPPAIGFAKKCEVDIDALVISNDYVTISKEEGGHPTETLIPILMSEIISNLTLPIAMRWGHETRPFIRPIHWIVSLLDQKELEIPALFLRKDHTFNVSHPHRFLKSDPIKIQSARHYEQALETAHIIVNPEKRLEKIKSTLLVELDESDIDNDLLNEVVFLTENPVVLTGKINPKYLQIPQEIIIQCMKKHQKFFPLIKNQILQPAFLAVADNVTKDNQSTIIAGYERVLTARLEDVRFFWEEDQHHPLDHFLPKLKKVVFQKGLGTIQDKVDRMMQLTQYLNTTLDFNIPQTTLERAVTLCKADLVSQMVFELPDLQGIMGALYAKAQGEDPAVSTAIQEHYLPKFAGDTLPHSQLGILLSIADKTDTIIACFQNDLIPTGSQDPWGVRRAIYALLQIASEHRLALPLENILNEAYKGFQNPPKNQEKLTDFFTQRLRSFLIEKDLPYDLVDAKIDSQNPTSLTQLQEEIQTITHYKTAHPESFKLITETATRIQRLAEKSTTDDISETHFKDPIEHDALKASDAINTLEDLQKLSTVMTVYFEKILVMDKDEAIQKNRLATLKKTAISYKKILGNPEKIILS
jgi:glycyl-tRNA synthetase beta chain